MTREDIIRMAQEAGLLPEKSNIAYQHPLFEQQIERFADLVASAAIKEALAQPEQEPVAILERDPSIGRLRVTYEDAVTELDEGVYPLYTKPQIEVGCAECGVNGGHALYCVACAEKFVGGYKDSGVPAVRTGLEQVSPDTPPQRTWVEIDGDDWIKALEMADFDTVAAFEFFEAKLKELNT